MHDQKQIVIEAQELRAMLDHAAEEGAKRALAAIGLHDSEAANDVRELRQVMADWRAVKRSMFTSVANTLVLGVMALIGFGVLWHLRKGP